MDYMSKSYSSEEQKNRSLRIHIPWKINKREFSIPKHNDAAMKGLGNVISEINGQYSFLNVIDHVKWL